MSDVLGPGPRTRVRRLPEKARYDRESIYAVLDHAPFCHLAAVVDGLGVALPTLAAREGDTLYVHGSRSNRVMTAVRESGEAWLTATLYDGIRVARSAFESSIAYRSVVVVGPVSEVRSLEERRRVLDLMTEAILPGRTGEIRPATDSELRRTMVLAVRIAEASLKVSAGPTDDDAEDQARPIWSGVLPARLVYDEPVPSTDGAMAQGLPVPASVRRRREAT